MPSPYFIGLDLGTTSVKACAFDEQGKLIEESSSGYALNHPVPGAAVQDPEEVMKAAQECLAEVVKKRGNPPQSIGISTAMHSVILLDEHYQPISPVITWADTRAVEVMTDFSVTQRQELLQLTGTPVHPMSPLVKLRWLKRSQPDAWQKMAFVSDLKSYLVNEWTTNGLLLDTNLASATGLYAAKAQQWAPEALELAGVTKEKMPKVVAPTQQLNWKQKIAEELGVTGVPLVIGGSDGCLANLGSGLEAGDVALSIGTSGAVRTTHQQAVIDPAAGLFNYHLLDDNYVVGGATNNGGKIMEWLFELLGKPYQTIGEMIEAAAEVDSDGLVFTPFIYGERAPIYDANASGSFTGMRGQHVPAQYVRAALEGVTDNLVVILRNLEQVAGPAKRIVASGGFTRSKFWVKLLAARAGRKVIVATTAQASAYGAALMGKLSLEKP